MGEVIRAGAQGTLHSRVAATESTVKTVVPHLKETSLLLRLVRNVRRNQSVLFDAWLDN